VKLQGEERRCGSQLVVGEGSENTCPNCGTPLVRKEDEWKR
jgi:predicted RNA-binding Zn-ribbon protein involved in translation (DUF1610 family)